MKTKQYRRLTFFLLLILVLAECLPGKPNAGTPSSHWWGEEALAAPLKAAAAQTVAADKSIAIGAAGFTPAQLTITMGEQVEWHNTTAQEQTVHSGRLPGVTNRALFLPVVLGGVQTAAATVAMAAPPVVDDDHFEITIPLDGHIAQTFTAMGEHPYYLVSNPAQTGAIVVEAHDPPSAPPNAGAVPLSLFDSAQFLFSGDHPRQTGVAAGAIDPQRIVVLRGTVLDHAEAPAAGVVVHVVDHPEFGQTLTQKDGSFDLALNGGGVTTLAYEKAGFLPIQRTMSLPWQEYVNLDVVVLSALDTQVTTIDLSHSADFQIARGRRQNDNDGSRQATLLVGKETQASMTLPNGKSKPLSTLKIRATEYTVGTLGMASMPGSLPPSSGYTYAVELTVDEALAAGATGVQFSKPLINYTENFIGAPVGSPVPAGYYDRQQGRWIPSKNGIVIKLLAESNAKAQIDINGDGVADSGDGLSALGITDAELAQLANLYDPGQELWRVEISHFSPWDFNWPFGLPPGAQAPRLKEFVWQDPNDPCRQAGSIIGCETQTLGENLPVAGAPFNLVYQSDRVPGWQVGDTLRIPITGPTIPPHLKGIQLQIDIAGERHEWRWCSDEISAIASCEQAPKIARNLSQNFLWDGLDAYNRKLYGRATAHARVMYIYDITYYSAPEDLDKSFDQLPDNVEIFDGRVCGDPFFCGIPVAQHLYRSIGAWDASASDGLGGWTVDIHHAYDPLEHVLHLGNGTTLDSNSIGPTAMTIAGGGVEDPPVTGGIAAKTAGLDYLIDIAEAPDGTIYTYSTGNRNHIVKIDPKGIATTIAGKSYEKGEPSGDGGPALQATLGTEVLGLAVGPDGSLYFSAMGKNYPAGYIRKIDRQGIITTIAGINDTSAVGGNGDGGPALQAKVSAPIDLVFGPDGCLYFGERAAAANGNHPRIRKINLDGTINTVAGGGTIAMDDPQLDSGIPAATVNLATPYGIAFGPDGSMYIAHSEAHMVTRVATDGMITRFAGNGNIYVGYDGQPAASLAIGSPVNVAVDREGAVYIRSNTGLPPVRIMRVGVDGILKFFAGGLGDCAGGSKDGLSGRQTCIGGQSRGLELSPDGSLIFSDGRYRVRRFSLPFAGFGPLGYAIPSQDGSVLYEFDANGRHQRTSSALTGALLYRFVYDAAGRLIQIVDANNNVTRIERTESGWPTAIVAPGGQRTTLEIGGDGYLSAVGNPGDGTSHMTYGEGGLLASFADPSGAISSFAYSGDGRLARDQEPLGDYKSLARIETATAATVTVTSKLGHATIYAMQILPNGDRMRTVTDASGATTTLLSRADGTHTTIAPDGTRTDMTLAADPRWGMAAAYATSISTTLPSGLQGLVTVQRKVELNDVTNPLSLKTLSEEVIVNGKRTVGTYRAADHTITTRSSGGRQTVVTIDDEGRTLSESAANQAPTRFTYDEQGRLTATAQGSGDTERRYSLAYNAANQLESITDPLGQTSRYSYNDAGLAAMQTLGDGTQIGYGYNDNGAVTSLTPAGRPAHTLAYTANGQLSTYTAPDAGGGAAAAAYTYNDDGLPLRTTRPDGQKVDFGYDGSGRLAAMNTPQGAYTYSYDGAGNPQVIKSPGNVMLTYHYDGPLLTGESWDGPVHGDVAYSYDQNLRATASRVNDKEVTYTYDRDSLLTSAGAMTLIHDGLSGQLSATTLGSVSDHWLYNEFAEAKQYQARAGGNALYDVDTTYDKVGRILTKTEKIGGVSTTYGYHYDAADRLDQLTRDGAVIASYSYDANGNRLTGPGLDTPATYDLQDRLLRYGDAQFTYTPNGEVASKKAGKQTTSYQYDVQGNLVAATLPEGKQISYVVDGLSRRIGKRANGTLVQGFLYQGQYSPVAETDGSGNVVSLFVYATRSNVPDYLIKAGVTYRILSDQLGSPRLVVNTQTGATVQRIDYDVWGNITADSNPGFQPFGFAGGLYDRDTQLTHFGAREYDAVTGRWRQKDPLGFDGGDTNLYAYAENNPVNLIDPTGTFIIIPVIIAAWAVVEVGLSIADAISTASTLMDPCATSGEKALAVGLFVVGLLAPGGGYSTAAKQVGREVRIIGHFGEYLEMAAKIPGSKTFHIPPKIAEMMTEAQIWSANRRFLDAGIRKAQEFILATPINRVKLGSGLAKEIDYLLEHGYKFAKNGLSLIPL